jgi:hypothetical protein
MEDEGRSFYCGSYETLEQAEEARDLLTDNDTGYFRNSNFRIYEGIE